MEENTVLDERTFVMESFWKDNEGSHICEGVRYKVGENGQFYDYGLWDILMENFTPSSISGELKEHLRLTGKFVPNEDITKVYMWKGLEKEKSFSLFNKVESYGVSHWIDGEEAGISKADITHTVINKFFKIGETK